jgi:hypothetical protein
MMKKRLKGIPFLIVYFPLLLLLGACMSQRPIEAFATRVAVPTSAQQVLLPPAVPERRLLTLEFPPRIRAGDSDLVRLTMELDEQGNLTPTVISAGSSVQGEVINISNVFDTHNVLAEARLDMAGLDVRPAEMVSETLLPGQKVTFFWSVLPGEVGKFKGTVWFYLHFVPKAQGSESRLALFAQPIEIEATSFLGLKANPTRWLGFSGALLSSLLGFPFLEKILIGFWKRLRP